MKELNIVTNCGHTGTVTDNNESEEINAMIGSGPHEEDELGDLDVNAAQEQHEITAMIAVLPKNKPLKDDGDDDRD